MIGDDDLARLAEHFATHRAFTNPLGRNQRTQRRFRCKLTPDKIKYPTEEEALSAEQWFVDNVPDHREGEPYECPDCHWFHRREIEKNRRHAERYAHESP